MESQFAAPSQPQARSAEHVDGDVRIVSARRLASRGAGIQCDSTHGASRQISAIHFAMLAAIMLLLQLLVESAAAAVLPYVSLIPNASATGGPTLTSARSRKTHGTAGTFDLVLSSTPSNPSTEPRYGGPNGN